MSLLALFALLKNKYLEASRLIVRLPPGYLFLSVSCVLFICTISIIIFVSKSKAVLRLNIYQFIILLSEVTNQMWNNYPFSQRKKASKIAVGRKVGGNGKSGWENF